MGRGSDGRASQGGRLRGLGVQAAGVRGRAIDGPTRSPDKEALARAAQLLSLQTKAQDMVWMRHPKVMSGSRRWRTRSPRFAAIRRLSRNRKRPTGATDYIYRSDIFVGFTMVRIVSTSSMRAQSKRHFDEFAEAMEIIDVAPPAPGTQATPNPAALSAGDRGTNAPQ
jgi:hypothetical protein